MRTFCFALAIVVGLSAPVVGQTPPPTISMQRLEHRKQVQQQAADIARQLVGEVLDVQLQQFRDNNLTSHPWYREIRSMRDHLDEMVHKQMKEVVDILEKADLNDGAQRVKAFQAARNKGREVLVRIQVEQQILLRRLKIAELARQIQQLIEHQTKVHKETEALPGEPADRRHELNLAALEDQRDVTASFGQFKQSLRETSRFSGDVGREAAEAVQMVEQQQIDGLLGKAEKGLHDGDFTAAAGSQAEVIAALEALLQKIRHLQKTMDANSVEEKIAEALKKEEEIREATEKQPLEPEAADKLAAQQDELAKKIGELAAAAKPEVRSALENAKHEAQEAAASLLEQKQPEALAHEDKAAADLKAAAHEAEKAQATGESQKPQTAEDAKRQALEKMDKLADLKKKVDDELAKAMTPTTEHLNALAQAQKKVEEALQHQAEADKAAEKPPAGEKHEGDQKDADKHDPQAQVSEASKEAADLSKEGAPKAAETLDKAAEKSDQARHDAAQGSPQQAAADRKATKETLEEAKKELGEAMKQLAAEASKQMGEEAKESGELAGEAKPLDAEAAKDLAAAQQQAQPAAGNPSQPPAEMQAAQNGVRQDLAQASAELASHQEQIAAELAQAEGTPETGQEPGHEPDQTAVVSSPASEGAKKMGPGGPASPDGKDPKGQDLRKEPWFANLPPEARDTMRSNANRRPPPGYERRTQEYFENLDR